MIVLKTLQKLTKKLSKSLTYNLQLHCIETFSNFFGIIVILQIQLLVKHRIKCYYLFILKPYGLKLTQNVLVRQWVLLSKKVIEWCCSLTCKNLKVPLFVLFLSTSFNKCSRCLKKTACQPNEVGWVRLSIFVCLKSIVS